MCDTPLGVTAEAPSHTAESSFYDGFYYGSALELPLNNSLYWFYEGSLCASHSPQRLMWTAAMWARSSPEADPTAG